ncbi:hypothetical protein [Streptomyces antibioticus]|uniref:hypothetical protein n=1 Tax=Streptomyces antibioticus TaxID=1890 RepID=UPI0033C07079
MASAGVGTAFAGGPGGATATGGSGGDDALIQQNTAQDGRQNSACNQANDAVISLEPGRLSGRCVNVDGSYNRSAGTAYRGAKATGGSGTAEVSQQNIAQRGRQNIACDNHDNLNAIRATDGALDTSCANHDASRNVDAFVNSGGARAEGGSGTAEVYQQNIAQEGRQNTACGNTNTSGDFDLAGASRFGTECDSSDHSRNHHTRTVQGPAHATGGTATSSLRQQNTAQSGRQNTACGNTNQSGTFDLAGASRFGTECDSSDHSRNHHTRTVQGPAHATGGTATSSLRQQNTAQSGRQNTICGNTNQSGDFDLAGASRFGTECDSSDHSRNHHTRTAHGPAHAAGGTATGVLRQQNTAQSGRQNTTCGHINNSGDIDLADGSRFGTECDSTDHSRNHHTRTAHGPAHATGGTTTAALTQQNTAQSGRQNTTCGNLDDTALDLTGSKVRSRCTAVDASDNTGTRETGRGAHAEGGSSTGGAVSQDNIAQAGRQNNACDNHNSLSAEITSGRHTSECTAVDQSVNAGTTQVGGGARAEGGSGAASVLQQNIAQEGRQNNACGNTNDLTLTATGNSRTTSRCLAVDRSVNIEPRHGGY